MAKAKAGLRGMNAFEKQSRASIIHTHMVGNPMFPVPSPSMLDFGTAIEELKVANLEALDRGRRALLRRDLAEQLISEMITRLAGYVNSVALGDSQQIRSAGFELAKRPEPISRLSAPRNAKVLASLLPNTLKLSWAPVPGAVMYQLDEAIGGTHEDPEWTTVQVISNHRTVLDGKDKASSTTFRVKALGRRVDSPYKEFSYIKAA